VEAHACAPTLITLARRIRIQEALQYIQIRQNEDGGYSFARRAESSAADTYYAIQILRMLGAEPRNAVKTINFMKGLQREDASFDSVNVAYDVVKTLDELGARPISPLEDFILSLQTTHGEFGVLEVRDTPGIESPFELEGTHLSLELLRPVEHNLSFAKTTDAILTRQNPDGSFGRSGLFLGISTFESTYHAVSACSTILTRSE
jgi:hypothetical protein